MDHPAAPEGREGRSVRTHAASVRVLPGKRSSLRLSTARTRSDVGSTADALFRVFPCGDSASSGSRADGAGEVAARGNPRGAEPAKAKSADCGSARIGRVGWGALAQCRAHALACADVAQSREPRATECRAHALACSETASEILTEPVHNERAPPRAVTRGERRHGARCPAPLLSVYRINRVLVTVAPERLRTSRGRELQRACSRVAGHGVGAAEL